MKLKDAIVLGIGFSIGTIIFDTVILCIDKIVTFGNNVTDVMNNEELSFAESVDKVMNNIRNKKNGKPQQEHKRIIGFAQEDTKES